MKRGIDGKDVTKEKLSIQDGDYDLPRLRLLASRSKGLFPFFLSRRHLDSSSSSRGTQETPGSLRGSRTRWDRSFFQQVSAVTRLHVHIPWVYLFTCVLQTQRIEFLIGLKYHTKIVCHAIS